MRIWRRIKQALSKLRIWINTLDPFGEGYKPLLASSAIVALLTFSISALTGAIVLIWKVALFILEELLDPPFFEQYGIYLAAIPGIILLVAAIVIWVYFRSRTSRRAKRFAVDIGRQDIEKLKARLKEYETTFGEKPWNSELAEKLGILHGAWQEYLSRSSSEWIPGDVDGPVLEDPLGETADNPASGTTFSKAANHIRLIRTELSKRYMTEELEDISGEADRKHRSLPAGQKLDGPRPQIVTNFPIYAELVETLVGTCKKILETDETKKALFCFTTLSMPLEKWFNFQRGLFEDTRWTEYLRYIQGLSEEFVTDHAGGILCRCLVSTPEPSRNTSKSESEIEGGKRASQSIEQERKKYIWTREGFGPVPFSAGTWFDSIATSVRNAYGSDKAVDMARTWIDEEYGISSEPQSFIIIPEDQYDDWGNFEYQGSGFEPLVDTFATYYHPCLGDHRLCCHVDLQKKESESLRKLSKKNILDLQNLRRGKVDKGVQLKPRVPSDLFYVALVPKKRLTTIVDDKLDSEAIFASLSEILDDNDDPSLFCLATGSEDETLRSVHLYLLDSAKTRETLSDIRQYIKLLLKASRPLVTDIESTVSARH